MFKKVLLLLLLMPLLSVANYKLRSYRAVTKAIRHGEQISVYMDMTECKPPVPMQGYYAPNSVVISEDHLSFAQHHETMNNPEFPGRLIIEMMAYELDNKDKFTINTAFLDPNTNKKIGQQPPVITCELNKGVRFYAN